MSGKSERVVDAPFDTLNKVVTAVGGLYNNTPTAQAGTDLDIVPLALDSFGQVKLQDSAAQYAAGAIAGTSLTTSFSTLYNNATPIAARILTISNGTDQDAQISFNGSSTHLIVKAGTANIIDFAAAGRTMRASISARAVLATGTTGNLFCGLLY